MFQALAARDIRRAMAWTKDTTPFPLFASTIPMTVLAGYYLLNIPLRATVGLLFAKGSNGKTNVCLPSRRSLALSCELVQNRTWLEKMISHSGV